MSTLFATSQRVGNTISSNAREPTLGKHYEGVADGAHRAAETAGWADPGIGKSSPESRTGSARAQHSSRGADCYFQATVELSRRVAATTERGSVRTCPPAPGDSLYSGVLRRVEQLRYFAGRAPVESGTSLALSK